MSFTRIRAKFIREALGAYTHHDHLSDWAKLCTYIGTREDCVTNSYPVTRSARAFELWPELDAGTSMCRQVFNRTLRANVRVCVSGTGENTLLSVSVIPLQAEPEPDHVRFQTGHVICWPNGDFVPPSWTKHPPEARSVLWTVIDVDLEKRCYEICGTNSALAKGPIECKISFDDTKTAARWVDTDLNFRFLLQRRTTALTVIAASHHVTLGEALLEWSAYEQQIEDDGTYVFSLFYLQPFGKEVVLKGGTNKAIEADVAAA